MTPDTTVSGAPISIGAWKPHNYDGSLGNGDLPLKMALAKSMNVPAVHLLQTVGIQTGAQMVRRFGIKVPMAPYLPSALGRDRSAAGSDGLGLLGISKQGYSR